MFDVRMVARNLSARVWVRDDRGVTSVEYALLATLIAAFISVAVALFGISVNNLFTAINAAF